MMNEEFLILRDAYNKYGHRNQVLKLAEEASELARACARMVMEIDDNKCKKVNVNNFFEEIADVQILIDQFFYFYESERVREYRKQKLEYLKNNLG
jgi:hypothetical protein